MHQSGFRSDFCSVCGSPVPNPLNDVPYIWVPAGLLEANGELEIVAHFCVSSRAEWDSAPIQGMCFEHLPELPEFFALLSNLQV